MSRKRLVHDVHTCTCLIHLPPILALLVTSLMETAEHKMAALIVMFHDFQTWGGGGGGGRGLTVDLFSCTL